MDLRSQTQVHRDGKVTGTVDVVVRDKKGSTIEKRIYELSGGKNGGPIEMRDGSGRGWNGPLGKEVAREVTALGGLHGREFSFDDRQPIHFEFGQKLEGSEKSARNNITKEPQRKRPEKDAREETTPSKVPATVDMHKPAPSPRPERTPPAGAQPDRPSREFESRPRSAQVGPREAHRQPAPRSEATPRATVLTDNLDDPGAYDPRLGIAAKSGLALTLSAATLVFFPPTTVVGVLTVTMGIAGGTSGFIAGLVAYLAEPNASQSHIKQVTKELGTVTKLSSSPFSFTGGIIGSLGGSAMGADPRVGLDMGAIYGSYVGDVYSFGNDVYKMKTADPKDLERAIDKFQWTIEKFVTKKTADMAVESEDKAWEQEGQRR